MQKIETCQCNAVLAITGAFRGSSKERLYQELGFEYLRLRRWLRKLCFFKGLQAINPLALQIYFNL